MPSYKRFSWDTWKLLGFSPSENQEEHGSSVALFLTLFGIILIFSPPETSSQQTRMFCATHTQASVVNEINLSESKILSFIFLYLYNNLQCWRKCATVGSHEIWILTPVLKIPAYIFIMYIVFLATAQSAGRKHYICYPSLYSGFVLTFLVCFSSF